MLVGALAFFAEEPIYRSLVYAVAALGVGVILLWLGYVLFNQGKAVQKWADTASGAIESDSALAEKCETLANDCVDIAAQERTMNVRYNWFGAPSKEQHELWCKQNVSRAEREEQVARRLQPRWLQIEAEMRARGAGFGAINFWGIRWDDRGLEALANLLTRLATSLRRLDYKGRLFEYWKVRRDDGR